MREANIFEILTMLSNPGEPLNIAIKDTNFDILTILATGFVAAACIYGFDIYKKYREEKESFIKSLKEEYINSVFTITKSRNILAAINPESTVNPNIEAFIFNNKDISFYKKLMAYEEETQKNFNNDISNLDLFLNISSIESTISNINMFIKSGCLIKEQKEILEKNLRDLIFYEMHNMKRLNNILKYIKAKPCKESYFENSIVHVIYKQEKEMRNIQYNIDLKIAKHLRENKQSIKQEKVIEIVNDYFTEDESLIKYKESIINNIIQRLEMISENQS
jgi:hypothetical protein